MFNSHEQNSVQYKTVSLSFLNEEYSQHPWIRAYIDGVTANLVKNGGAGVYIKYS
uniref:Uncharacterized protein n=1 Tax=Arion vulgaris TaxID=1028688 RepID=A0A0B6Z7E0_9EUPU